MVFKVGEGRRFSSVQIYVSDRMVLLKAAGPQGITRDYFETIASALGIAGSRRPRAERITRDYSGLGGAIASALGIAGSRRPGAERTTRDYSNNAGLRRDWPHVAQCCRTIAARLAARLPQDYPTISGDSRHGWRVALVRRLLPLGGAVAAPAAPAAAYRRRSA